MPTLPDVLADRHGRKGVVLGILGIALTVVLGVPTLSAWRDSHVDTRVTDHRWTSAGPLASSQSWVSPAGVAFATGRHVVVGSAGLGSDNRPAVWYSDGNAAWRSGEVQLDPTGDTTEAAMASVAYGDGRWVAVGSATAFGHSDAAVWESTDGRRWVRVAAGADSLGGPGGQGMFRVAVSDEGWVAVGYENFGGDANGAVWRSMDGRTWQRVRARPGVFDGPGDQVMSSIVSTPTRWIAGGRQDRDERSDAVIWVSEDGLTWSRVDAPDMHGPRDDAIYAMAASGGGVVAVGASRLEDDLSAVVWTSEDGITWSRVPFNRSLFGGPFDQRIDGVVATRGGWVAVGGDESSEVFTPAVWSSRDGRHWKRVLADIGVFARPERSRMTAVSADGDVLVAVGSTDEGFGQRAEVWLRREDP